MMTALSKQDSREVARPLKVLEKLIKADIEAGEKAGMDYYRSAGEKLNEAQEGHYEGDAGRFWKWAEQKFGKTQSTLRTWMALDVETSHKRFKSLQDHQKKSLGWKGQVHSIKREWTVPVDDIAERARNEARRLAAQEELTRQQERDAEAKLGLRLIDIGFKVLARELHPDKGGSRDAMSRLNRVRDRLKANV
jgi:hypothetical protein